MSSSMVNPGMVSSGMNGGMSMGPAMQGHPGVTNVMQSHGMMMNPHHGVGGHQHHLGMSPNGGMIQPHLLQQHM